jgi:very-short-patch-repair endonuclease
MRTYAKEHFEHLTAQYEIKHYRVDFAIPDKMLAIELDGHQYHKSREQRTTDAQRERALQELGWRVFRFTGSEIHRDMAGCVEQIQRFCQ